MGHLENLFIRKMSGLSEIYTSQLNLIVIPTQVAQEISKIDKREGMQNDSHNTRFEYVLE